MDRALRAMFNKSLRPNRVQHLVVSDSKHFYFRETDQVLGYQKKELDPRTCGNRKMLTRQIVIDEDTGVLYGELTPCHDVDLLGFLARAWAAKKDHPMRGFPASIHVPRNVLKTEQLAADLRWMAALGGVTVSSATGGFGPPTVAAREYERELLNLLRDGRSTLSTADAAASVISLLACCNAATAFREAWRAVQPMDPATIRRIDDEYTTPACWRSNLFSFVLGPDQLDAVSAPAGA